MVELELRHLKGYAHFDAHLELSEANSLVNNPQAVVAHQFYPFISEIKSHQPFRKGKTSSIAVAGKSKPDKKTRLLMKAARRDSAIFAAYRILLLDRYEAALADLGLSESVIAYRHIPVAPSSKKGKCNIHHAHEVFERVKKFDESVCVVLDISKYFDHIDHGRLKSSWREVLGVTELPKDHYSVFRAITKYSCVDLEKLLFRLGHTRTICDHKGRTKTVVHHKNSLPVQLCSPEDFRGKVAGRYRGESRLVRVNENGFGIPQGSPISDVLANMYLLEFDRAMKGRADSLGGIYRRYSDDIVFVIPGKLNDGRKLRNYVRSEIGQHGSQLQIKPNKTHVVAFVRNGGRLSPIDAAENERHPEGLEYLGFRFDGDTVRFRDSTVSKLRNKVRNCVKAETYRLVRRYPSRSVARLVSDFPVGAITPKVGRIDRLLREEAQLTGKKEMSFWSYARIAQDVFGSTCRCRLFSQVPYKKWIRNDVEELVPKYVKKGF